MTPEPSPQGDAKVLVKGDNVFLFIKNNCHIGEDGDYDNIHFRHSILYSMLQQQMEVFDWLVN